jgi:hypothetical protein
LAVVTVLLGGPTSIAQIPAVTAKPDTTRIRIGEQIKLQLEVRHDPDVEIYWPQFPETFGRFEVVETGALESREMEDDIVETQSVVITSFDSGHHVVDPFSFSYRLPRVDTLTPLLTEGFAVDVTTVDVDTSQAFKPIVGPYSERKTFLEMLPYIAIPLIVAVLATALWLLWRSRRRRPKPVSATIPPDIKPGDWALQKLRELEQKKLWQHDMVKQHYVELTDILRIYIERQCHVSAIERTSAEIMLALGRKVSSDKLVGLNGLLGTADLVKFAKAKPLPDEHARWIRVAEEFVRDTNVPETQAQATDTPMD